MLDSARTRLSVSVIKQVITVAARYGFNRLHWHLTDDQGWRFDVPEYPRLIEVGSVVPRGHFADYDSFAGDSRERAIAETEERWSDGYYTDDEIAEVVAHAAAYGITIVPEVDLPGHMMAAILAHPELGRPAGLPLPEGSMREHMWWPARNDLLWPTEEALQFLTAVIRRVAALFPGEYVHIGGDECAYAQWSSDPRMEEYLAERGLTRVEELQAWFMDHAMGVLAEQGKKVMAWDEASDITDVQDILLVAWDEERGMERVAKATQQYVFADARWLYLNRIDPEGAESQKGMIPGITVSDILSAEWAETEDIRCVGIQACLWSEVVLDDHDVMQMLFPRLLAVAERIWNPALDVAESRALIAEEYDALVASGVLASESVTAS